ncbi:MAG: chemotaxis protein CheR [Rhodospirillales bacterium 12-54-5]|nr:MAG: chemotaxis protein CheR [Rhodospirillales bacterium 12-54-5]
MAATDLTPDEFGFISTLLKDRSGLALTPDKGYLLETRLQPIARTHGLTDVKALIAKLRTAPPAALVHEVIESMTTNESMFFRDTKPFDHLSKVVFPALKAAGKSRIRIWSAACSTGQEPYSIAMTIKEEAAKYPGLQAEIYATDLAEKVLERSRSGIYSQFEVQRGLPIMLLMKYFKQVPGNMWQLNADIKSMVTFAPGNLLGSFASMGKFDIIFCRNVLIYFDEKAKADVMNRIATILNPPGYLFLGGAESTIGLTQKLVPMGDHRGLFTLGV